MTLSSVVIRFAVPSLTVRRYGACFIGEQSRLHSIVLFMAYIAAGSFVVIESVTLFVAVGCLPDMINGYKIILLEKTAGLVLLVACAVVLYLKDASEKESATLS